ncbi:MAG: crossover junction endodeoxyribonuclease RuvC [Deltaproteobacteria bacterium]|nr:crossover junction endodeoxyribonuclease RuvC [Deltaproteobacteria bacterium]
MSTKRILGIDPGTLLAGFAVIETVKTSPIGPQDFRIIEAGVLRAQANFQVWQRIGLMHTSMHTLIEEFKPSVCVMENVYMAKNAQSALKLGQARGAFISAAARCQIAVREIASTTVKRIVCGKGHADKQQVNLALESLLGFQKGALPFDASDAVAIALAFGLNCAWESKWPKDDFPFE